MCANSGPKLKTSGPQEDAIENTMSNVQKLDFGVPPVGNSKFDAKFRPQLRAQIGAIGRK